MSIIVRKAEPADLPALRELFLRSRRDAFVWERPATLRLEDFDALTEGELRLLAQDDAGPAGFVSVWEPDRFIHHLHVSPLRSRQGLGRLLLRTLPGWPTTRYRLKCLCVNKPALAFYRACRFREIGGGRADDLDYVLLESDGLSP